MSLVAVCIVACRTNGFMWDANSLSRLDSRDMRSFCEQHRVCDARERTSNNAQRRTFVLNNSSFGVRQSTNFARHANTF